MKNILLSSDELDRPCEIVSINTSLLRKNCVSGGQTADSAVWPLEYIPTRKQTEMSRAPGVRRAFMPLLDLFV